jgi:site-specific DNA-methyltransferase (adenine-specific)
MDPLPNTRLHHGKCQEILRDFPSDFVDVIWTDPPYFLSAGGLGYRNGKIQPTFKGNWDSPLAPLAIAEFHQSWMSEAYRILKEGASIWITSSHHTIGQQHVSLQKCGFQIRQIIIWQKTDPPPTISQTHFPFQFELVTWATKGKPSSSQILGRKNLPTWSNQSVWPIDAVPIGEKSDGYHPTQKPLELVRRCLAIHGISSIVLDPFMGSGTTLLAALELGIFAIGIEQDLRFFELARARIASVVSQKTASVSD